MWKDKIKGYAGPVVGSNFDFGDFGDFGLRGSIHRHIHHQPDAWLLSWGVRGSTVCSCRELGPKDLGAAKSEAEIIIRSEVSQWADMVNDAWGDR